MKLLVLLVSTVAVSSAATPVTLVLDGWKATIEPETLTVRAHLDEQEFLVAAGTKDAVEKLESHRNGVSWRLRERGVTAHFDVLGRRLHVRLDSETEQILEWPRTGEDRRFSALILPEGEGLYVPLNDPTWTSRIAGRCFSAHGQLSMPFWSYQFSGGTFTYQLLSDIRTDLCGQQLNSRLSMTAKHRALSRDGLPAYELEMWPGNVSPIAPALEYRESLTLSGDLVKLADKIRANPAVEKLLGAIHMYVWGDGRAVEFVDDLRRAGIQRAWIGFDQNTGTGQWIAGREFVAAAKAAGYLVGPYDTYSNAQDPATGEDDVSRWPGDLYPAGCIRDREMKPKKGFAGRGCELSSAALEQAEQHMGVLSNRLKDRLRDGANSYFLDVDAFGELFDDYSPLHPMTQSQDRENRIRRMRRARQSGVVLGSEEGVGWSVPVIDFAHGAFSVQNSFLWSKKREFGTWWPPARPRIFFQPVDPGAEFSSAKYDPAYRLPLYEAAFHSSIVATDRWDVPMTKFPTLVRTRQILEVLYGVPSIWAMDRRQFRESREMLTKLAQFFEPIHRLIGTLPLDSFEWLTPDRLVQRTNFGNEVVLTANFGSAGFADVKPGCVQARMVRAREVRTLCP